MSEHPDPGPPSYEEATKNVPPSAEDEGDAGGAEGQAGASGSAEESGSQEKRRLEEGQAAASGSAEESGSQEKRRLEKAEEAGWREEVISPGVSTYAGTESVPPSAPMVLPPGLQPLLMLDTLTLKGTYERGKGRRYRVSNKNGVPVLYARSTRRGHHRPKDFQIYDSTRTSVVGQLTFSVAADCSLYANLECPPRVSLATIRAEDSSPQPDTTGINSVDASKHVIKYTICNVLGHPVFTALSPTIMDTQDLNIKVYSVVSQGTAVADIMWDTDHPEAADEVRSFFGDRGEDSAERWVKLTFPLDLELKMKAALLAMCLLKDKIDHRMSTKGGSSIPEAFGTASSTGHHSRRRLYKHL